MSVAANEVYRCAECSGPAQPVTTALGPMFRCEACRTDWFAARAEEQNMRRFQIIDCEQLFWLDAAGRVFWLNPSKYHRRLVGLEAGAAVRTGSGKAYWAVQIGGRKYKRSHIVFALTHGRWPEQQIDHINGDSLDDRPSNLREATPTQNAWNHKRRAKRSPLPMGVRVAGSGRFVARIGVNKRQITIGTFESVAAAEEAYRAARRDHFGEFA